MRAWVGLLCLCLVSPSLLARVKLNTLPVRDRVVVNLEHPQAVLVSEDRWVPLLAGENAVDFSWANTAIDADSVVLTVMEAQGEVSVLSVAYPNGENALLWRLGAQRSGPVRLRIAYLIGGLSSQVAYRATTDASEKQLFLDRYLRLVNRSNESFGESGLDLGQGMSLSSPVGVDETRQILVERIGPVAIEKLYVADLARFGYLNEAKKQLRVPMFYAWENARGAGLGEHALASGKVRIFQTADQSDGFDKEIFLGEDRVAATPVGEAVRLAVGTARDVQLERRVLNRKRSKVAGNLYHLDVSLEYRLRSFKDGPLRLRLREDMQALAQELGIASASNGFGEDLEWRVLRSSDARWQRVDELSDSDQLVMGLDVAAGEAKDVDKPASRLLLNIQFRNLW